MVHCFLAYDGLVAFAARSAEGPVLRGVRQCLTNTLRLPRPVRNSERWGRKLENGQLHHL